jgi:RNA polymerase sigma-70 factor (ECF subfamily)
VPQKADARLRNRAGASAPSHSPELPWNIADTAGSYLRVAINPVPLSTGGESEIELMQSGYRYALSLTHHGHDAEDLLQEAWLHLCRRYGAASSRAALFTTIRHLYIDRCRRNRVVSFHSLDETADTAAAPVIASPGTSTDLSTLLATLRPGEREAVYLHYIEGHTAEEVGVLTDQPRGTILSLLHRALKKLQYAVTSPG